ELVVLAGDDALPGHRIPHRMVTAVVAEREPRRRRADRPRDELVAEADAEDRDRPGRAAALGHIEEDLHARGDVRDSRRVSRTVRDDDAVRRPRQEIAHARVDGVDPHRRTALDEAPDLVLLHAGVDERDLWPRAHDAPP